MDLQNPCGAFESVSRSLSARRPIGPDTTVGLLANDKKNADVLLQHIRRRLETDYGIREFRWLRKDATRPADLTHEFVAGCDVVAAAVAD
jgi:hypothetical protein